jgi:transposase InsO family protein
MRTKIGKDYSVESLCASMGMSRQAHYKWLQNHKLRHQQEEIIEREVKKIRHQHPRMGGKKLHIKVMAEIVPLGFSIGRDRFFKLLSSKDLLVEPRRKKITITISRKMSRNYQNLIIEKQFSAPNQAWAVDITYLRLEYEFRYLALVKDLYSHKILGYDLSDSLTIDGSIRALKMALKEVADPQGLIHHSDNGIQYEAKEYMALLEHYKIEISRAAKGCPWENGSMERTIGALKDEYGLDAIFKNEPILHKAVKEIIYVYNHERPHWSIELLTPAQVHQAA